MNIKKPRLRFAFFAFALAAVSALSGCDDADRNVAYHADDCCCDECNVFNESAIFSNGANNVDNVVNVNNGGFNAALYRVPVEEPVSQATGVFPPAQNWTVPTTTFSPYAVPAPIVQLPPQPSPVRLPRECRGCYGTGDCRVCKGDGDASEQSYSLGPNPCSACNATGRCSICGGVGTR